MEHDELMELVSALRLRGDELSKKAADALADLYRQVDMYESEEYDRQMWY